MPEKSLQRDDNIFLGGCERSGINLVYSAITSHPDLRPKNRHDQDQPSDTRDMWYFRHLFAARKKFSSALYGTDVDTAYVQQLLDMTKRFCAERHGAASGRWVAAHPHNGFYVTEILAAMPRSRIILNVRHPQEVIWSQLQAPWAKWDRRPLERRIYEAARHWRQLYPMVTEVLKGTFGDQVLLVRHEELVAEPETIGRQILTHVGVEPLPEVLANLSRPVLKGARNADNSRLQVEELRQRVRGQRTFCQAVLKQLRTEMAALGYDDIGQSDPVAHVVRLGRRVAV